MYSSITDFIQFAVSQKNLPPAAELEAVRHSLAALLAQGMHRGGHWERPPAHLGMPWADSWSDANTFEQLVADCFVFTVLQPFGTLAEFSRRRPQIDRLVALGVGWFLADTERLFDPLGYALRKRLLTAARRVANKNLLYAVVGDARIDTHTTVAFAAGVRRAPNSPEDLAAATASWLDDLMPDLLTARGPQGHRLASRLETRLLALHEGGIESFHLADLVGAVRDTIDARWRHADIAPGRPQARTLPDLEIPQRFADRQRIRALFECVGGSIDHLTANDSTHGHLSALWLFLRHLAQRKENTALPAEALEHHLGIPSDQVHPACSTLRRLLDVCRGSAGRDLGGAPLPEATLAPQVYPTTGYETSNAETSEPGLTTQLLTEARFALANILRSAAPGSDQPLRKLRPGNFFIAPGTARPPILWLVVETGRPAGTLRVVPTDLLPLVGRHDLPLDVAGLGPLKLRCGFELEIPADLREPALVTPVVTTLAANELERIDHHRQRLATSYPVFETTEKDIDSDPDLEDWIDKRLGPACRDLESFFVPTGPGPQPGALPGRCAAPGRFAAPALLATMAFLLVLALGIFLRCGQQTSGNPQYPTPSIVERDCATLLSAPQWCGELEEPTHARLDLHPHLIHLPQGGRLAGRTRDRFQVP